MQKITCHPWLPGSLASEYGVQYPAKQVPGTKKKGYIQQRNAAQVESAPFEANSSQRIDYQVSPLSAQLVQPVRKHGREGSASQPVG